MHGPDALGEPFADARPHFAVAAWAARQLRCQACLFDLEAPATPGRMGRTFGEAHDFTAVERQHIERFTVYPWRGLDPFAHRAVSQLGILRRLEPAAVDSLEAAVLRPQGFTEERRVTLYDGGAFVGHLSFYRTAREPLFDEAEVEQMERLAPEIASGLGAWQEAHRCRPGLDWVQLALGEDDRPGWVIDLHGHVLHANPAARGACPPPFGWAAVADEFTTGRRSGASPTDWSVVALQGPTRTLLLVRGPRAMKLRAAWPLPAWLLPFAMRMAGGQSDKLISDELDVSLRTVRTAATRIYLRLGVHSRAELVALARDRALPCSSSGPREAGPSQPPDPREVSHR